MDRTTAIVLSIFIGVVVGLVILLAMACCFRGYVVKKEKERRAAEERERKAELAEAVPAVPPAASADVRVETASPPSKQDQPVITVVVRTCLLPDAVAR